MNEEQRKAFEDLIEAARAVLQTETTEKTGESPEDAIYTCVEDWSLVELKKSLDAAEKVAKF